MQFLKIKELKEIEAFDTFEWTGGELKKYNLVYGWNGSGKTTISRLFYSLENKKLLAGMESAKIQIQTDGEMLKETDVSTHTAKIKVFNDDFVKDNLSFTEKSAKKILIAGKENKDAAAEIDALKIKELELRGRCEALRKQRDKLTGFTQILTEAGTEVVKKFSDTPQASGEYSGRKYDRSKVAAHIEAGTLSPTTLDGYILSQPEHDKAREVIKGQKDPIELAPGNIDDFSGIFQDANALLKTAISVESIANLDSDHWLKSWVETGYHLHKDRNSDSCQFCNKPLDAGYIERLGKYFTNELIETQKKIDAVISSLGSVTHEQNIGSIEVNNLYSDLAAEYLSIKSAVEEHAIKVRAAIEQLVASLREKRSHLQVGTKEFSLVVYPKESVQALNGLSDRLVATIKQQNERIASVSSAAKSIEMDAIANTLKAKDYFTKKTEFQVVEESIKKEETELENTTKDIALKHAAVVNAHIAIAQINESLKEFFGEAHIYLESDPKGEELGYVIKRRGRDANNLSEGEKSVLALLYFLTKIEEEGFDVKTSLIVVDDPVDSQDEVFLFKTFSLIKGFLKHSGQLIILTHNYPFFNLVRDWFINEDKNAVKAKRDPVSEYYCMSAQRTPTTHGVRVEALHELLKNHKTEYQYLFFKLYWFNKDTKEKKTPSLDTPLVPNVARKMLEYFAGFKWACDMHEQFGNIIQSRFESEPKDRKDIADYINKFVQEFSHGKDFSRPITATIFEAPSIAEKTLRFIEIADPDHYEKLTALCES